jgi:multicomponent Na+:H+ antiporter subunit F
MDLNSYLLFVVMPILCLSVIFTFVRFIKGPTTADRVISLDLIITTGVGIIGLFSIIYNHPAFMDVAMILALIAFLGTIAFSYYLIQEHKNKKK